MTTERQRLANRRNAQRSTGPKTKSGRKTAGQNALKHGLSSSVRTGADTEQIKQIKHLLQEEISSLESAENTALKIWEYEKTEEYMRALALREFAGPGLIDHGALEQAHQEAIQLAIISVLQERQLKRPGLSKAEKEQIKVLIQSLKFLTRVANRKERTTIDDAYREYQSSRRYFKRASNQLIKAVKAIEPDEAKC